MVISESTNKVMLFQMMRTNLEIEMVMGMGIIDMHQVVTDLSMTLSNGKIVIMMVMGTTHILQIITTIALIRVVNPCRIAMVV